MNGPWADDQMHTLIRRDMKRAAYPLMNALSLTRAVVQEIHRMGVSGATRSFSAIDGGAEITAKPEVLL